MENEELIKLNLEISAGDSTSEELDRMTINLISDLKDSDAESVEQVQSGPAPEGAKGFPVELAIAVLPTTLPKVIETLQSWIMRNHNRTVKFEGKVAGQPIKFEGSAEDLQKLIESLSAKKPKKSK